MYNELTRGRCHCLLFFSSGQRREQQLIELMRALLLCPDYFGKTARYENNKMGLLHPMPMSRKSPIFGLTVERLPVTAVKHC